MTDTAAPPTLDDVARLARVSTATVSRCINSPDRVAASTRARVETAIKTLGYTPNFAARFMAAKRTFTIGAIIPTMENAIFARGLQAFQEELHQRGYTLLVSSSAYKAEAEEEQIRTLVARGADGLLLIGHDRDPQIYDYLAQQHVPVLVAWSYSETARVPSIGFDNRAAMRSLAERMIALGHKRIAMISGISEQNDRARLRIEGVKDAMAAHGLDPERLAPVELPYDVHSGAAAFVDLMSHSPRPSLVLCGNDVLAVGALRGAHQLGLKVPEDVSITGFDDIELAQVVTPELTTVHVPHREMGRKAAQELVGMVEEKRQGVSEKLETTIMERSSVSILRDQSE
ncbi:LacI family DNA-binding transcriptional regulator [Roseobacter sp. YSTF-M11]|uniref:LacI family DNA-binding transcriptional regulator n=1 Tax=Roseobacter insulae TaxID=2859783 RepID=A0A9X1FXG0_9RHOB|nr:LacI family DNA-binding transcriptional regulator [Roseobacter insulae]MBW4709174.1 LacI family DNA-binding transcriptional regulator [Roseobacter insulae]